MLLNCDPKIWTRLLVLNSSCKLYVMNPVPWNRAVEPWLYTGVCENCHILESKCIQNTPAPAWNLQIVNSLLASWLPIQGPVLCWSCCDVNVRLKEGHYTCRKTSAAMPVSEAVMCQASWKSVLHLPKTFLHLERLWRAYPTGQSCDIPWFFLLAFQNENKVFIKECFL